MFIDKILAPYILNGTESIVCGKCKKIIKFSKNNKTIYVVCENCKKKLKMI